MRIGIDVRLWNETGVGRYIRNLVANLQEIDNVNEYVLFIRSEVIEQLIVNNLQLTKSKKWKIVPVDIRWHTVDEQLKFPKILNKENLDLMHFPYFSVPVNYKRPYIVTIHDLILNHFPTGKASTLPLPFYQIKRYGYNYVLNRAIKNAKKIIVPLNTVRDDLIATLKVQREKIIVTKEGYDNKIIYNKSKIQTRKKYFLYVGNAYPHKNLEKLIEAFMKFKKDQNDIEMILVGQDDYFYKKLRDYINREGIQGIAFKHDVTDVELANFYSNALAFISPSLMEGFGLPALEAMALSCPVILSDIPSFKEVCKDVAIYFNPRQVNEIVEKMHLVTYMDESEKRIRIEKGIERISKFSWEKMARQTLGIYESSTSANSA